ncbi:MAG: Crossover junction endonuclease mus81 [Cirrosporium novae-zelandiae]|nr:MAG: Crossover junction endonuclease mus81 [Cirrosporium novae-zelandiae]
MEEYANPLLVQWIKEGLDFARERNSKGVTTYKKAYESMKACPLTFKHPSEAQQLHGIGPKLCDRLTQKMKEHCEKNGLPMPKPSRKNLSRKRTEDDVPSAAQTTKKPRKLKPYVPTLRSGAYAIILALATLPEDSSQGLTKAQTIEIAQPYCDSSFSTPSDPTKFYTAWNSMTTLVNKDLIYERGRPLRRYVLTEEGWEVAKRIKNTSGGDSQTVENFFSGRQASTVEETYNPVNTSKDSDSLYPTNNGKEQVVIPSRSIATKTTQQCPSEEHYRGSGASNFVDLLSSPEPTEEIYGPKKPNGHPDAISGTTGYPASSLPKSTLPSLQPLRLLPGSFTVQLIIDNREVRTQTDRDYIQEELIKKGIKPLVRPLDLGDALWVAKFNDPQTLPRLGEEGDEIVLDWIVERKRLDDLVSSIKDGRFHEQKFRLQKSGVKNVIYLVEEISMTHEASSKYRESVDSAIASTQVVNGYFVKRTEKLDDTIQYLARMTAMLKDLYESKPLHLIPTSVLDPQTYLPLLSHLRETFPSCPHYITFAAFSGLASKSDYLTLQDVFLKMLMCTRGLTGDKAIEVQKHWKTPRALIEAFEKCEGEKERNEMVMKVVSGSITRLKVGKALSVKMAEIWGS